MILIRERDLLSHTSFDLSRVALLTSTAIALAEEDYDPLVSQIEEEKSNE